jgi:putative ABC transport system permease protein
VKPFCFPCSYVIAAIVTFRLIPALNRFTDKSIEFNPLTNPIQFLLLSGAAVFIGIIAGLYPPCAFGFSADKEFEEHQRCRQQFGKTVVTASPVVVQFSLSALLIISTVIVYNKKLSQRQGPWI